MRFKELRSALVLAVITATALSPAAAFGATRYVRPGATGNGSGSDWLNAYPGLPATLQRGDIYYLAGGSYGSYNFNTPASGAQLIAVRKATLTDHGTSTGWSDSYATQVALFTGMFFSTSYWHVDGQERSGWTSGYGIEISAPWSTAERAGRAVSFTPGVRDITVSYVNVHPQVTHQGYGHLFYAADTITNIKVDHSWLHDNWGCFFLMREWNGVTIEHNYMINNDSSSDYHAEALSDAGSDNVILRYNHWVDVFGTAFIVALVNGTSSDNWEIHGNLFYHRSQGTHFASGVIRVLNRDGNTAVANNWRFHNNTVANMWGWFGGGITIDAGTGNVAYNNIWWANGTLEGQEMEFWGITLDYNLFDTAQIGYANYMGAHGQALSASPFVDFAGMDLHLARATDGGTALGAVYAMDMEGRARGGDAVWDRGAYEYGSGSTPPPTPPPAPKNLRILN